MRQLDILFIEPNSSKASYQGLADKYAAIETPTWSLLLAQACRAKGYGVGILDANAERLDPTQTATRVYYENPRLACIVVYGQNPNSGTTNMSGAYLIAEQIKMLCPTVKVCFVGSHTSALPKEVLSEPFVDFVLLNEGVYALQNLLATDLVDVKNIKGIGYKVEGVPVLNAPERVVPNDRMDVDLPGYAWDLLPYKTKPFDLYRSHFWHAGFDHNHTSPFASLYTSLGCRFGCEFCMINIVNRVDNGDNVSAANSKVMRFWSPEFIIKEFDKLQAYGVNTIRIVDEMFLLDKRYFEPLLDLLGQRDYSKTMKSWVYSRVDTARPKFFEQIKNAGIQWLALGIESANTTIRREVTKGTFEEVDIRQVVKDIEQAGLYTIANYIFGLPDDNLESMQQTLDLALELNTETANMYPCQFLPGSPLYLQAKQNGWKLPSNFEGYSFLGYDAQPARSKHCTAEEILKFRDEAWQKYFTSTTYLDKVEKVFGSQQRQNVEEMTKIKLKRKLLGD